MVRSLSYARNSEPGNRFKEYVETKFGTHNLDPIGVDLARYGIAVER